MPHESNPSHDKDETPTPSFDPPPPPDGERNAFVALNPKGFFIRHPPPPDRLEAFQTPDDLLFQTIHMGAAEVDTDKWTLVVTGFVSRPFSLNLSQLKRLPSRTVTAIHECYGSPLVPPTKALWRIGNVTWTGVPLHVLVSHARPDESRAQYIWSEGLDRGAFGGVEADRYQKDLPMAKALAPEVLVAYAMNGEPLGRNRGGPVRLVVPGWFGTNSTKWLCKLTVQERRAPGPFTTTFYNEKVPSSENVWDGSEPMTRPVWEVQVNSMIVRPELASKVPGPDVVVKGWAWSHGGIADVAVTSDAGKTWTNTAVEPRTGFSWQQFQTVLRLPRGLFTLAARATSNEGVTQPWEKARNHVHRVEVEVV